MRAWHTYRGGRRGRQAPKTSWAISLDEARKIVRSNRFARELGIPINTHVTVNFSDAVDDRDIPTIVAKTLKTMRQWLRRNGCTGSETTHIWVREKPGARHAHVHFLLHLPARFSRMIGNRQFARFLPAEALIDVEAIIDRAQPYSGTPVLVVRNSDFSEGWARYVLKGIAMEDADEFGITHSHQGRIVGKRVGIAENIGSAEWERWSLDHRGFGREFALERWTERVRMSKSRIS